VATVGRDPSSDLVLNDPKCSRRHAVIETGPEGVIIRDSGSANGIYVNGHKTERSRIRDGDLIKLGDVLVTLLPEAIEGTVVMEEGDFPIPAAAATAEDSTDRSRTSPRPPREMRPRRLRDATADDGPVDAPESLYPGRPQGRPLTVTLLIALWALSVPLFVIGGVALSWQLRGAGRAGLVAAGLLLAALSVAMAVGLWQARRWACVAQLVIAGLGLFLCPFTLASIAVLVYMLRPAARWYFSDRREEAPERAGQAEVIFAGAIVGAVLLGVLLTAALTVLTRTARTVTAGRMLTLTPPRERAAIEQLKTLVAAQDAFHSVCNTGYGDLKALRQPGTVIAAYPADGPAFLRGPDFERAERDGYRYTLTVEDEMPRAPGCPTRRFRRFLYSANPLGPGRSLVVGPDGAVRVAEGRPATLDDPPVE
jgi:hypothetical protein